MFLDNVKFFSLSGFSLVATESEVEPVVVDYFLRIGSLFMLIVGDLSFEIFEYNLCIKRAVHLQIGNTAQSALKNERIAKKSLTATRNIFQRTTT